jgi:hypothetical protein
MTKTSAEAAFMGRGDEGNGDISGNCKRIEKLST